MKIFKTALTTIIVLFFSVSPLLAIDYNGIGGMPAYPKEDNPKSEFIFIYENAPGSVVEDGVVVINNTSETKTILVYATDTTPSSGGGFACKQYVEEVTDEGTWIKLEKTEVTLEANSNEIVPFTVTIPTEVSAGEHNACIVIQEKIEESTEAGINLSFRAAIRTTVLIPGDMIRELSIKSFSYLKNANDNNIINLILSNTGNVSLDASIDVQVHNFFTGKASLSNQAEYSILHSTDQEFNYDLDNNPWGGIYQAKARITYDGNAGAEILEDDFLFVIVPSIYAMGGYAVTLIIALTSIFLFFDSKGRVKRAIKNAKEYVVVKGDTLTSIGKEYNVKWKLIAKINNKKAPYELSEGERLLIPTFKSKKKEKSIDTPPAPVTPIQTPPVVQPTNEVVQPTQPTTPPTV